jgi:hypothetical protein
MKMTDNQFQRSPHKMRFPPQSMAALMRWSMLEAWRNRFALWLLMLIGLGIGVSLFAQAQAITESTEIQIAVFVAWVRFGLAFIWSIHVVQSLTRELESGFVHVLLAHPMSRLEYVVGRGLGLTLVSQIAALILTLVLICLSPPAGVLATAVWGLTLALELLIITAVALFFSLGFARLLPALASTLLFYGFARVLETLQYMAAHPVGQDPNSLEVQIGQWMLAAVGWVVPHLGALARTEWLLDANVLGQIATQQWLTWLISGLLASIVLWLAAAVDFYGHEL